MWYFLKLRMVLIWKKQHLYQFWEISGEGDWMHKRDDKHIFRREARK